MSDKFVCKDLKLDDQEETEYAFEPRIYITLKNKKGVMLIKNIYWQVCNVISPECLTKDTIQRLREVIVGKSFDISLNEILGLEKYIK